MQTDRQADTTCEVTGTREMCQAQPAAAASLTAPVSVLQARIVLSALAEKTVLPSADSASALTPRV